MDSERTRRRNLIVIVQARDLDDVRGNIERALRKFDPASFEVMPGVWHLAASAPQQSIKANIVMAVSDWEDDRVMVIDNPDGWSTWDGHRGQYVRTEELLDRWVRTFDIKPGKTERWRHSNLRRAEKPWWVIKKRLTGTKIA